MLLNRFENFEAASRAVLAHLRERIPFGLWMMTRTSGKDWIVLQAADCGYGVEEGNVFKWTDSFCSRMVNGHGPRIAPRAQEIPAYREAPIGQQVPIGAYIGVPVASANGRLFGTLCGIDPMPHADTLKEHLPTIELFAKLLGSVLAADLVALERTRELEKTLRKALTDELTGLRNRRGWKERMKEEEGRARRYGTQVAAIIIDLDGLKFVNDTHGHAAGDEMLRQAGRAIAANVRVNDTVARLGGDEFGILAVECDEVQTKKLCKKIVRALDAVGIKASAGHAVCKSMNGLEEAVKQADANMYDEKARRKKLESSGVLATILVRHPQVQMPARYKG